ncbi:hypothetical protein [Pseudoxanthomonas jiangsuensis]|nr:hypothetical protein [Pseudoxanthomonas jiangsuensis]
MGLGGIAVAAVLREQDAGWPMWTLWAGTALPCPHLAPGHAGRNQVASG